MTAAILAVAMLNAASLFAQSFAGDWTCHSQGYNVPWHVTAAPGSAWTTVQWGNQKSARGGIAYVGYVAQLHRWVYRDFHYDGSYADITSSGPVGNSWTWTGPYYPAGDASHILHGAIVWKLSSPARIDRVFRAEQNGKLVPTGDDYCTKS